MLCECSPYFLEQCGSMQPWEGSQTLCHLFWLKFTGKYTSRISLHVIITSHAISRPYRQNPQEVIYHYNLMQTWWDEIIQTDIGYVIKSDLSRSNIVCVYLVSISQHQEGMTVTRNNTEIRDAFCNWIKKHHPWIVSVLLMKCNRGRLATKEHEDQSQRKAAEPPACQSITLLMVLYRPVDLTDMSSTGMLTLIDRPLVW